MGLQGHGKRELRKREGLSGGDRHAPVCWQVELIQAEHQYSLTECMEDRTQPSLLPSLVLGNEREQDAAKRRLTYCRQELQSVLEGLKEQNLLCEDIMHMLRAQFAGKERAGVFLSETWVLPLLHLCQ